MSLPNTSGSVLVSLREFGCPCAGRTRSGHPGEDEQAGRDAGRAENDQPRVGLGDAEDAPAEQFAEDEQPGALGDACGVVGSVRRPDRGRDLEQEGDRQGGAQTRAAEQAGSGDEQCGPHECERRGAARESSATAGEHHGQCAGEHRRRDGGHERSPKTRQREVAGPGGVVDARQRCPRPGHPGRLAGARQACQLGQELRHGKDRGHEGQQAEDGAHPMTPLSLGRKASRRKSIATLAGDFCEYPESSAFY